MQLNLILEKLVFYKKTIFLSITTILLIFVMMFSFSFFFSSNLKVLAGNFDFNYKKIPFDVSYIDLTLSSDLDTKTINKENFEINPKIDGTLSLINKNTIRYTFLQKLTIGQDISISLKTGIKSITGKNLEKDYNYIVSVVESPKVLKITPVGNLDNLSQNIAIFFNIPMVSLTNLDSRDNLSCPINIEPKIEGSCKWTTPTVLEFIPKNGFEGATKYLVSVKSDTELLYKLPKISTGLIETTRLKYKIGDNFSVNDGIIIDFNFSPDLESLRKSLVVMENHYSNNTGSSLFSKFSNNGFLKKDFSIEYLPGNDSKILVSLKDGYNFDGVYQLNFSSGIKPKNGNILTDFVYNKTIKSYPFLNSTQVYQNIFSGGKLFDTKDYTYNSYIPTKDVFLNLNFEKNINVLDKSLFYFEGENGKIDFDLSYQKIEQENKKIVDNKSVLKFKLNQNLLEGKTYRLVIKKDINLSLKSDIVTEFKTSPLFKVKDFIFKSYSKSCVYLNNRLPQDFWQKSNEIIKTIPNSRVSNISDWDYDSENLCPNPKDGEYLYVISTRLNPNTPYSINIPSSTKDEYGNNLSEGFLKNVKTGNIDPKDKYVYISLSKEINLIPKNIPIILNLQTINEDNISIQVCEMDKNGFIDYSQNRWETGFSPKCLNSLTKKLKTKNNYWNLTNNKFDLEKEITLKPINSNIILLRGYNSSGLISFTNVFIKSDLNITQESGINKKLLFITDFSGNKLDNLNLEFLNYDSSNKKIIKESPKYFLNKSTGIYEIENTNSNYISPDYNYVIASNEKYFGILDLGNNSFSDYDFKYVGGNPSYDKNYLYLYTERPIYKPGDNVFFKGLLRDFDFNGYKKSSIGSGKLEILDSSFSTIYSTDILVDKNSNFNGSFIIPKDVKTGEFTFRFTTFVGGNQLYYKNDAKFYIEEYRKPDFKIDIENINKDYNLGDKLSFNISPKYYFGGNMISSSGQYSVLSQNYFFDGKGYSDFQFGQGYDYFDCVYWGYCQYNDNLSGVNSFLVDENGNAKIDYQLPIKEEDGEKLLTFNFDVTDKDTNKTVTKSISTILHNTDSYVGLKVPYWNDSKLGVKGKLVVLDYDANPLSQKLVKIELIKRDWKIVKEQGVDGIFYDNYSLDEKLQNTISIKTDNLGLGDFHFNPNDSGEYMIKTIYTGKNGKSFTSSSVIYISGDDYTLWNNGNNDTTDLLPEKNQLLIGETSYYTLKSPINNGKALIIIEKDDGILDYFIHDIKSYGDKIEIKVKDNYYPNFYVRAFLIGKEENNLLPIYKRALVATKVSTEHKKLNISVIPSKKVYKTGEQVYIEVLVKDSKGNFVGNANGSISLVDESLLALVGNPIKNPYAFFYDMKRYLGTFMSSTMINLIEKLEVKDATNGEKGGAGDQIKGGDSKKKRGLFKDTAFWSSDFTTDKNGKAFIKTTFLPDNLTTWVIETIVSTPYDNKIGINYSTITTSNEVLINDNLPNFMGVGDKITLSPVIFNKTGVDGEFDVNIGTTNLNILGPSIKRVLIKNNESKTVNFEVGVFERKSFKSIKGAFAKVSFSAKQVGTNKEDSIEKVIQIKDTSVMEGVATTGSTKDKSYDESIDLGYLKDKIGQVKISYGATLFSKILDSVDYLSTYPYGCSEQKTSVIMPNIYIKNLYNSTFDKYDLTKKMIKYYDDETKNYKEKSVDQTIKEYLVDIRKYQKNDGGFVYWYDIDSKYPNYSNFSLSSYILDSMSLLNKSGYKQDQKVSFNLVSYLKKRLQENKIEGCTISNYNNCKYSYLDRLEAIEALQNFDNNDYDTYKFYKILEEDGNNYDINDVSIKLRKSIVLSNFKNIKSLSNEEKDKFLIKGKTIINDIINNDLVFNPRGAYIGKTEKYSRVVNTALLLKVISEFGEKEFIDSSKIIENSIRWIMEQKNGGSFGSTQDNILVINSISSYIEKSGLFKDLNFNSKLSLNSNIIEEKQFNLKNKFDTYSKYIDLKLLKSKNTFNFSKNGNGTLYYDISMNYFLTGKDVVARDEGFSVIKKYYDYNDYKRIDDLKKKEWGKYLKGEISYNSLKYKKLTFDYITPISYSKVGQLVIVRNTIITPETRDKVAFESYIPAGSEIINPNLATSTNKAFDFGNEIFERSEYRIDRFFGYTTTLYSGIYDFSYLIRFTHAGQYYVKPTQISEFYNNEVFGRSDGEIINVLK